MKVSATTRIVHESVISAGQWCLLWVLTHPPLHLRSVLVTSWYGLLIMVGVLMMLLVTSIEPSLTSFSRSDGKTAGMLNTGETS